MRYFVILLISGFTLSLSFLTYGYFFQTPDRPWSGYWYSKKNEEFKITFDVRSFRSASECIRDMNWNIKLSYEDFLKQKKMGKYFLPSDEDGPFRPVGCGFASNNFFLAYFMNQMFAGTEVKFLCENLNPAYEPLKERYMAAISVPIGDSESEFFCRPLLK